MRILHVVPTYLPAWRHGGPIWAVHGLARALVRRGHEVLVFTTNLHGDGVLDVPVGTPVDRDGVSVRYFGVGVPRRLYRAPALAAAVREELPRLDVAHLHSLFLWPTLAAARAAEAAKVPYFVSPRGMLVADLVRRKGRLRKRAWLWLFEARTLARAAGLVVTSELEAREARAFGLPLPPLFEVANGIDPAPFAAPDPRALPASVATLLPRGPLLLFLGRISWKKGLDLLIAALPRIPSASLVVAGGDDEGLVPALERLAADNGVSERVLFLGHVELAQKAALLAAAAALVLPSHSENFANVVLEAMASGCPVVVTPEVGLATVVSHSGAGLVAPRERFADALRELVADPVRLQAMRTPGPRLVAERFGWESIAARMEEVYRGARP